MKRSQISLGIILALLLAVGVWLVKRFGAPSSSVEYSLRLKWLYDPGFAGELVAAHEKIFEKHGVSLRIEPGGFESDPIKLVANGSNTFGVAGADTFLLARSRGVPIIAFAAGYIDTPVVYYAMASSGIKTPADWKGKRMGVQEGQDTATVYRVLLRKAGLSEKDVTEVPVKYDFSLFLDGRVDVWPGYAATQSYMLHERNLFYQVVVPTEQGVNYLGTVYFTTEKIIREHPEAVQSFLEALVEGWNLTYQDQPLAIKAVNSFDTKTLTPALIKWNLEKQALAIKPAGREYCGLRMSDLENLQQILLAQKLMKDPVDLKAAVELKFLNKLYPAPVK